MLVFNRQGFQAAISLGPTCRARHQIKRCFHKSLTEPGIFDWQGTPQGVVALYFRNDFRGMFDFEDLALDADGVFNARYQTRHKHQFRHGNPERPLTWQEVREAYPAARAKHESRADRMRAYLEMARRVLFVMSYRNARPGAEGWVELAIKERFAHLSFEILTIDDGEVVRARLAEGSLAQQDEWMGDDASFDRAFCAVMPRMVLTGGAAAAAIRLKTRPFRRSLRAALRV